MTFMQVTAMRMKDMVKRKEFFGVCLVSLLLFLIPAFLDLLMLRGSDFSNVRPPWYYFALSLSSGASFDSPIAIKFAFSIIIPLFSCAAYSYCCFDEARGGIKNIIISRTGRVNYYLASAFAVFISGFFVVFIPLLLNGLAFLAAVPFNAHGPIQAVNAYMDTDFDCITYFAGLANNHHYLFNLLYCFIPSFFCAMIGLLSFSLSLFIKKSKLACIAIPFIIYLISGLLVNYAQPNWALAYIMMPTFNTPGKKFSHFVIYAVGLLIVNIGALTARIRLKKDEL